LAGHLVGVLDPGLFRLRRRLNPRVALVADILDAIRNPLDHHLGAYRVITEGGVDRHEEIREARGLQIEVAARTVGPTILEGFPVFTADIHPRQRSADRVKPSGVDDDVEVVLLVTRLDARGVDALDRRFANVNQQHVGAVELLVIATLERDALGAKRMVLRHQLLRDDGIFDARANLVTDELGEVLVRLTIRHNVVEIGEPFRKSWLRPQLFIAIEPLFARDIERIAHVEGVIEAERRFANPLMDFLRVLLELALRLGADGAIAQRRTVIRRALEDRELADVLGDLRDQ